MENYSVIKANGVLKDATAWMNLENILLNKISQSQKTSFY